MGNGPVGAQVVLILSPLYLERDCAANVTFTVWPGARLLLSSCCGASQPSCQACGVFMQREPQQ